MNKDTINIIDKNGVNKTYDIMMTFDSDNTNKSYVVYTNYEIGADGRIIVYASTYENHNGKVKLGNVDTKEEAEFINKFLNEQIEDNNYYIESKND